MNTPRFTSDSAIQQLLHSPRLPQVVQQFQAVLESEQERRERFYNELREDQKAEFINGEVIVHTPVKLRHSVVSDNLFTLLHAYVQQHNLGFVGHEKLLVTLSRNDYEPDISFWESNRAQAFTPEQMKFPAPDLVIEVLSETTEANDRGVKFEDYAAHGVAEYWMVDPVQEFVEQYALKDAEYELLVKAKNGVLQSAVISGFEIPVRAAFDPDETLSALKKILE